MSWHEPALTKRQWAVKFEIMLDDVLGGASACRESFCVFTFGTYFIGRADIPTAKARLATHGHEVFSEKSHPISCWDAQYVKC